ncbi:hypothetical protein EHQ52_15340 [Leptospira koniambonensis]|uniref:Uncharacterized protein n=1 Tax=Leptospira koniambonensis TaxID=2484950 RepID=A0A4R9J598_9LEPT|nr:hypothetical protein [Leptospira koniambonensis]TGL31310.1 hypothetical protein EHQ52_15340 [Leptospira koniambonensis]
MRKIAKINITMKLVNEKFYSIEMERSPVKYARLMGFVSGRERREICKLEGKWEWEPVADSEIMIEDYRAIEWPDLLPDYYEGKYFIFSDPFFNFIHSLGIPYCRGFNVSILSPYPKGLPIDDMPNYYLMNTDSISGGRLIHDPPLVYHQKICPECGQRRVDVKSISIPRKSFVDPLSWNGIMLFSIKSRLYCTEEFVKLIRKSDFTNIRFTLY